MTTSLPIGQLFSLHINIYQFTFYEQSRYMRIPNDQNAKYDPVIMAQQVKLPFTDTLQAGILLLSMHWESKRKCNFPRVTDSTVQIQSSNSLTPSPLSFLLSSLSPFCLCPLFLLLSLPLSLPSFPIQLMSSENLQGCQYLINLWEKAVRGTFSAADDLQVLKVIFSTNLGVLPNGLFTRSQIMDNPLVSIHPNWQKFLGFFWNFDIQVLAGKFEIRVEVLLMKQTIQI